ncbi:MAG: restriction endonuclease [Opitutales bacterium]|nr:restriction endonuclease [Opitutales bacterium]
MSYRKRRSRGNEEELIKLIFGGIVLISLMIGGIHGFGEVLVSLLNLAIFIIFLIAATFIIFLVLKSVRHFYFYPKSDPVYTVLNSEDKTPKRVDWTWFSILKTLPEIDWYQFEKLCAAILRAEGFGVERRGGANPDGGVDLIAEKNKTRTLIQCKHYRKWKIKEPTVRQLLGSMVDFKVDRAAIFFYGEATQPAVTMARKHGIGLVDGVSLSERAEKNLSQPDLDQLLKTGIHHCPKCESPMVLRTGNFKTFWGCSHFPHCRGRMQYHD